MCLPEIKRDCDEAARLDVDGGVRLVVGGHVLRIQRYAEPGNGDLSVSKMKATSVFSSENVLTHINAFCIISCYLMIGKLSLKYS